MTEFTNQVPTDALGIVRAKAAKLNKRAAKLGLPPIVLEFGEPHIVKRGNDADSPRRAIEVRDVTVKTEPIKLPGYTFSGRVDLVEGEPIICTVPGETIPTEYRTTTGYCDHCKTKRLRNAVYVFRADAGGHIQVGHNCARDFLGHDAQKVLWIAEALREIDDEIAGSWGSGVYLEDTKRALTMAAAVIRLHGWVSKQVAYDFSKTSTSGRVFEQITRGIKLEPRDRIEPTEADEAQATATLAWVRDEMASKPEPSDYEHNLVVITKTDHYAPKRLGLLVSAVAAWQRHTNIMAERKAARDAEKDSAYVGEVGKRLRDLPAKIVFVKSFENNFGVSHLIKFRADGNVLVWWKSGGELPTVDSEWKLTGTVKRHEEYDGVKQTTLTRCILKG